MTTKAKTEIRDFQGVKFWGEWTEFGDRVTGEIRLPSGARVDYEVERCGHSNFYDHGGDLLRSAEDVATADLLFPMTLDATAVEYRLEKTVFRRATPEFAAAAWAAAGVDPHEGAPTPAPVWVPSAVDLAETAAMCELEGTPLADPRRLRRPDRTCIECGSPVYGDLCTHCHEC